MSRNLIIVILFTVLCSACHRPSKQTQFIDTYGLQGYDSVFAVSGVSCGGCIHDFFTDTRPGNRNVLVFDTSYETDFMLSLRKFPHRHVPQQVLDECFDNFGNVIILYRTDTGYARIDYENLNIAP